MLSTIGFKRLNEQASFICAANRRGAGISKKFGDRVAVDHLDLEVPARVCFGLLGPNGAGKTTTLRMIYGVTRATSGTIRVFGMDIEPASAGGALRGSA